MDFSPSHLDTLVRRRQYEREQERIADTHRLAEERGRAREAAAPIWEPASLRAQRPGYLTRF